MRACLVPTLDQQELCEAGTTELIASYSVEEAAATVERVRRDYSVDAIYCSDLRRARQTAEVLQRQTKAPVTHTSDLRPWNLGVFCGQRVREVLPYLNLLNRHPNLSAPSGESFYQFYGRYAHCLNELLVRAEQSTNCIVAVTHVRNLLATATIVLGGDKDKMPVKGGPHTGALVVVEKIEGSWKISNGTRQPAVTEPEVWQVADHSQAVEFVNLAYKTDSVDSSGNENMLCERAMTCAPLP